MEAHAPEPADRELVERFLRTRSDAAFLALYDRHTEALYAFAARLVGSASGHEPAELVQEAWLRALTGLSQFRWGSSLRTWLCGIVLNRWREVRQREVRERRFEIVEGSRSPEGTALPAGDAVLLERALATLPEGYREVLLLHDVEGYTHEEIARHFGIVEGTSKSQLHRARRALREALGLTEKERA
ncbi:MAG: RNA polymerase sigma factor [Candidatus Eiseniibacteriota bacterium]